MPNVEIHGLNLVAARELKRIIFRLFREKPHVKEMVVTISLDYVENEEGNSQPYLRLANSCQEHTGEIIETLESLDMDIEHLRLEKFIPKKSSREAKEL